MAVRLFIGNLPYGASEADLRAHFAAVAEPSHVVMPVDRETGRPRGFAFVEFMDRTAAEEVVKRLNGGELPENFAIQHPDERTMAKFFGATANIGGRELAKKAS